MNGPFLPDRIYLAEPDLIRTLYENRVRRSFWAIYILLTTGGVAFILGFTWRVS